MQSPVKDTVTVRSSGASEGVGVAVGVGVEDGVVSVEMVSKRTVVAADCSILVLIVSSTDSSVLLLQAAIFTDITAIRPVVRSIFKVLRSRENFTISATFREN